MVEVMDFQHHTAPTFLSECAERLKFKTARLSFRSCQAYPSHRSCKSFWMTCSCLWLPPDIPLCRCTLGAVSFVRRANQQHIRFTFCSLEQTPESQLTRSRKLCSFPSTSACQPMHWSLLLMACTRAVEAKTNT